MAKNEFSPGPLEPRKHGETSEPGHPQPAAEEIESARVLANQARESLAADGFSADQVRRLADQYVALDLGEGLEAFLRWARTKAGRRAAGPR